MRCNPISTSFATMLSSGIVFVGTLVACDRWQSPSLSQTAPISATAATPWPADQAGLEALGGSLLAAWFEKITARDRQSLEAAMQPCFQRINYEGAFDRAAEIDAIVKLDAHAPEISDVRATRVGEALVVSCSVTVQEKAETTELAPVPSPRLGVWQPVDGTWKLAAWVSLNMPQHQPAPSSPRFTGTDALDAEGGAVLARFLEAEQAKKSGIVEVMLEDGVQAVDFKGAKGRGELLASIRASTMGVPRITDVRATRCGELTVVTCTLVMTQSLGSEHISADPTPFLLVFRGPVASAKVVAIARVHRPA